MTQLPSLDGKALVAALKRAGFEVIRIKGSHHFIRHTDRRSFPFTLAKISAPG
jgi:predicted RNA binding protein YcfA (HicA-like mRNA interferase family)